MRWVGIDEAGYGPNLGPMVMTAVVAESTNPAGGDGSTPTALDFWSDLATTVDRAGGDPGRVWIDDSKAILHGGKGRDRLEIACLAAIHASRQELPGCVGELIEILGAGSLTDVELARWSETGTEDRTWPPTVARDALDSLIARADRSFRRPPRGELPRCYRSSSDRPVSTADWRSTARRRRSISKPSTGCSSTFGIEPPTVEPRSSRATSMAADTITFGRSHRPFPMPGSIAARRARPSAGTQSATGVEGSS